MAVVPVVIAAPAATTTAMTATTSTTIATVSAVAAAASISRLQASESGDGQRACQQAEDAPTSGRVVGASQLSRELLHIHPEKNSSIAREAPGLRVSRHSRCSHVCVPGRGAALGCGVSESGPP